MKKIVITENQLKNLLMEYDNYNVQYQNIQEIYYTIQDIYDEDNELDDTLFIINKLEDLSGYYDNINDICNEYDLSSYVGKECANLMIDRKGKKINEKSYINDDGYNVIETSYYLNCNDRYDYDLNNTQDIDSFLEKKFGVTDNPYTCGFILTNGEMLNLGGKTNARIVDHSAITSTLDKSMNQLLKMGYIRISPESPGFQCFTKPNNQQYYTLKDIVRTFIRNNNLYVDFSETDGYVYEKNTNPDRIMANLIRYFDEGIKPY